MSQDILFRVRETELEEMSDRPEDSFWSHVRFKPTKVCKQKRKSAQQHVLFDGICQETESCPTQGLKSVPTPPLAKITGPGSLKQAPPILKTDVRESAPGAHAPLPRDRHLDKAPSTLQGCGCPFSPPTSIAPSGIGLGAGWVGADPSAHLRFLLAGLLVRLKRLGGAIFCTRS